MEELDVMRFQLRLKINFNRSVNSQQVNMLNCFKDYKRYFTFWILELAWPKYMKLALEQQHILLVLHSQ